jgi:hypothetical protein
MQLVKQRQEHVHFAYGTQPPRHLSKPPGELADPVGVELENWQQLAQPAGGDPRPVDRADVPVFNAG